MCTTTVTKNVVNGFDVMKICVIGGAGFIGGNLVRILCREGHEPVILDSCRRGEFADAITEVDIRDSEQLQCSLKGDVIVHLAAVHRDDVQPLSLYDDVNVHGTENVIAAAEVNNIDNIIFTSSVAVYGFAEINTGEEGEIAPFNDYGRTKFEAELKLIEWQKREPGKRSLTIVRPTVVFGPGNRGNVHNLINQIYRRRFVMIGDGKNVKSMAYVENVAEFLHKCIGSEPGVTIMNYVDKPDLDMNSLISLIKKELQLDHGVGLRVPKIIGLILGHFFDFAALVVKKSFPISAIRVQKFTSDTSFSSKAHGFRGFTANYSLEEGVERTIAADFPRQV